MNYDDVHRQRTAYQEHKAPSSIPLKMPEHPAAVSLRAMSDAFGRIADACEALAAGRAYRRRTPSGTDCGLSVELPVADAVFLTNWMRAIREEHGATVWLCSGCWQLQAAADVAAWLNGSPLCESCREHAMPDPVLERDPEEGE